MSLSNGSNPGSDNDCDQWRWPAYDANYNVVGLFACEYPGGGTTYLERHEYTSRPRQAGTRGKRRMASARCM